MKSQTPEVFQQYVVLCCAAVPPSHVPLYMFPLTGARLFPAQRFRGESGPPGGVSAPKTHQTSPGFFKTP